jgi:hypothetical protein
VGAARLARECQPGRLLAGVKQCLVGAQAVVDAGGIRVLGSQPVRRNDDAGVQLISQV